MPNPILLVAAAALVDPDNRVLIAQRPPGKSMAGLWEFPGGKVADGETPEQALVRELREELDRGLRNLPGAVHLRKPQLREVPLADAALSLPQLGRRSSPP